MRFLSPASRATFSPVAIEPVKTTEATSRWSGQRGPDVAAAVHEVDGARREAGVVQHVDEQLGAERRELRRLPDRRAAEREAVDDRDARDVDREVPGRDRRDDADRLLDDEDPLVRPALCRRQHLARVAQDVLGRAPEVVGGVLDHLLARLADRLAGLAGDHAGDLLRPVHADVVGPPADLDSLEHARPAPRLEGRGGRGDGLIHLVGSRSAHCAEALARGRAAHLDLLASAGHPLAADECPALGQHLSHLSLLTPRPTGGDPPRRPSLPLRTGTLPPCLASISPPRVPLRRHRSRGLPQRDAALRGSRRREDQRLLALRAAAGTGRLSLPLRVRRGGMAARRLGQAHAADARGRGGDRAPGDRLLPDRACGRPLVRNKTDSTVLVLMFSTRTHPSVAVYPDSDKVGVFTGNKADDVMVRRASRVDYFDGEADRPPAP